MKHFLLLLLALSSLTIARTQPEPSRPPITRTPIVRHVILISIDGLHPDMYLDPSWPTPNLRELMREGTYADHLLSVFPSYTYPSHTAMLTGALPARSGIWFNQPKGSHGEWNWFTSAIKVPTLWQILKTAGLPTASVEWPCSVTPHTGDITYDIPEIWDPRTPDDRISEARKYATPGLIEAVEKYATGRLDSNSMNGERFCLDENAARAAAYIFKTYRPAFLALHIASVDDKEHDQGRTGDSVTLAIEANDRAIGDLLETIAASGMKDSTTIIIVGDHGFATIHQVIRPNILIKGLPAHFIASGGSAFLYLNDGADAAKTVASITRRLDSLPTAVRQQFRLIDRAELDRMGADSSALFALSAFPGTVFSSATSVNNSFAGPGTVIQQGTIQGVYGPTHGGHHGYDPRFPEMWTGFIAAGAGIKRGSSIPQLGEQDIAPLIAKLLGLDFPTPDGHLIPGILQ